MKVLRHVQAIGRALRIPLNKHLAGRVRGRVSVMPSLRIDNMICNSVRVIEHTRSIGYV